MPFNLQKISISGSAMKYTHLAGVEPLLCSGSLAHSMLSQELRHRMGTPRWGDPTESGEQYGKVTI